MAVTHPAPIRNAIADYVVDQLDLNTPPGKIIMQTAASCDGLNADVCQPGIWCSGCRRRNSERHCRGHQRGRRHHRQGRIAPGRRHRDRAMLGHHQGGGGDIQLNSVTISAGQQVSLTSLTYAAPA